MKADNISLLEFIGASKRTFYIPVYQRNYDWKKTHCEALFKDIEAITKNPDKDAKHFIGTIVYLEGKSTPTFREFTIIDGQQRLTTLMILLKVVMDACENQDIKDDIRETYLTNPRGTEALRIKLKPMKSDAANFQNLIDNKIDEVGTSQILVNYNNFKDMLEKSELSAEDIYRGIQKLEIVYISLSETENPQLIFESLNSTGLDLTQADLIRNYLLMGHEYHKQEKLYKNFWVKLEKMLPDAMISDYIRDYLTLKNGTIPNKDDVYKSFKRYSQGIGNYDAEGFLEELTTYGTYYSWFKYCNSPSAELNRRLAHFQKLKSTVVYPFLLSIFEDRYIYENIDDDELCATLDVVLSYVVRRLLCEMPTNALNKVFAALPRDIEQYSGLPLQEKVATVLANKRGKAAFPKDNTLTEQLRTRDVYKFPHIKFILEQIELKKSKETVGFDTLTVEHIMPQTLTPKWNVDLGKRAQEIHDKYLHTIGNLTLSGYNSELSNDSFSKKLEIYKKSNVCITKEIAKYKQWGESEILSRADSLINDIKGIWKYPDVTSVPENDLRTEFDFSEEVDVTRRSPSKLEIIGEIYSLKSWASFLKKVCDTLYQYDEQIFHSLIRHDDFKGRNARIIGDSAEGMRKPYKIAEDLYVETNLSANAILNYCKLIIEKFDGVEEVSSYELRAIED